MQTISIRYVNYICILNKLYQNRLQYKSQHDSPLGGNCSALTIVCQCPASTWRSLKGFFCIGHRHPVSMVDGSSTLPGYSHPKLPWPNPAIHTFSRPHFQIITAKRGPNRGFPWVLRSCNSLGSMRKLGAVSDLCLSRHIRGPSFSAKCIMCQHWRWAGRAAPQSRARIRNPTLCTWTISFPFPFSKSQVYFDDISSKRFSYEW